MTVPSGHDELDQFDDEPDPFTAYRQQAERDTFWAGCILTAFAALAAYVLFFGV